MQTPKDQINAEFPHQLSRDEFVRWWHAINEDQEPRPTSQTAVIYLGQQTDDKDAMAVKS